LLVVHVHTGLEPQLRQHCRIDVDEPQRRMIREQMTAALRAPLAVADGCLVVGADARGAPGYVQCLRLPQREGIDRASRPVSARLAVTVPHARGLSGDLELDLAAETAAGVGVGSAHAKLS